MFAVGLAPFTQRYSGRWMAPSPMSPTTEPPLASHASAVIEGRAASSPGADGGSALDTGSGSTADFEEPPQAARQRPKADAASRSFADLDMVPCV